MRSEVFDDRLPGRWGGSRSSAQRSEGNRRRGGVAGSISTSTLEEVPAPGQCSKSIFSNIQEHYPGIYPATISQIPLKYIYFC